jgi:CelD/BcsL family acetyltransferase involved in cellulose biosynthesis
VTTHTRRLDGFDDPGFSPAQWDRLLRTGDTDVVYLTWQWQRAWWETRGKGELLLIVAERDGEVVALAPFHARHDGMVYFLGSDGSDYLDFIGDVGDPEVLDAILTTAIARVPGFKGFRLESIPRRSRTGPRLEEASSRLRLNCYDEHDGKVPVLDMAGQPEAGPAAANKESLRRREWWFRRQGGFEVKHLRSGPEILPLLPEFYAQNIARRDGTESPSTFLKPGRRMFLERLTALASDAGWLRFTRVEWQGRAIACSVGFCYQGTYYWFKQSFDVDLARRSPGEVLLRQLLFNAVEEGVKTFDFGGDPSEYKLRYTNDFVKTRTWGLNPKQARGVHADDTAAELVDKQALAL